MGHIRLGSLPQTQKWIGVVRLIASNGDVAAIAGGSAAAAEQNLKRAALDEGLTHSFWLLTQIPEAAKHSNFAERLWELGINVPSRPTLVEIVTGFTRAVDDHLRETGKRSDLGEMAQHAASETLMSLTGRELPALLGATPGDVQAALRKLDSAERFSVTARDFVSRLAGRSLGYFLSREIPKHVGPERRFSTINEHNAFNTSLDQHCREASKIIKEFARDWFGKSRRDGKPITAADARAFASVAFGKLCAELRKRRAANA